MDFSLPPDLVELQQRTRTFIHDKIIPLLEEYCYDDFGTLRDILGHKLVDVEKGCICEEIFAANREEELIQALSFEEMQPLVTDQEPVDSSLADEPTDDVEAEDGSSAAS